MVCRPRKRVLSECSWPAADPEKLTHGPGELLAFPVFYKDRDMAKQTNAELKEVEKRLSEQQAALDQVKQVREAQEQKLEDLERQVKAKDLSSTSIDSLAVEASEITQLRRQIETEKLVLEEINRRVSDQELVTMKAGMFVETVKADLVDHEAFDLEDQVVVLVREALAKVETLRELQERFRGMVRLDREPAFNLQRLQEHLEAADRQFEEHRIRFPSAGSNRVRLEKRIEAVTKAR